MWSCCLRPSYLNHKKYFMSFVLCACANKMAFGHNTFWGLGLVGKGWFLDSVHNFLIPPVAKYLSSYNYLKCPFFSKYLIVEVISLKKMQRPYTKFFKWLWVNTWTEVNFITLKLIYFLWSLSLWITSCRYPLHIFGFGGWV